MEDHSDEKRSGNPEDDRIITMILCCAERTDGQVGRLGMIKILTGQKSKRLAKYGFDHMEEYGSLRGVPTDIILKHIDFLIERGCLTVTSFSFPMLQLTDIGRKRLDRMKKSGSDF